MQRRGAAADRDGVLRSGVLLHHFFELRHTRSGANPSAAQRGHHLLDLGFPHERAAEYQKIFTRGADIVFHGWFHELAFRARVGTRNGAWVCWKKMAGCYVLRKPYSSPEAEMSKI